MTAKHRTNGKAVQPPAPSSPVERAIDRVVAQKGVSLTTLKVAGGGPSLSRDDAIVFVETEQHAKAKRARLLFYDAKRDCWLPVNIAPGRWQLTPIADGDQPEVSKPQLWQPGQARPT